MVSMVPIQQFPVLLGRLAQLARKEPQVRRARMALMVLIQRFRVRKVSKGRSVKQGQRAQLGQQVRKEFKAKSAQLDLKVFKAFKATPARMVLLVQLGLKDHKATPEQMVPMVQ
jgi:plasmid stability protein